MKQMNCKINKLVSPPFRSGWLTKKSKKKKESLKSVFCSFLSPEELLLAQHSSLLFYCLSLSLEQEQRTKAAASVAVSKQKCCCPESNRDKAASLTDGPFTPRHSVAPVDRSKKKHEASLSHICSPKSNDGREKDTERSGKKKNAHTQNRRAAIPHSDKHIQYLGIQIICVCMWAWGLPLSLSSKPS